MRYLPFIATIQDGDSFTSLQPTILKTKNGNYCKKRTWLLVVEEGVKTGLCVIPTVSTDAQVVITRLHLFNSCV